MKGFKAFNKGLVCDDTQYIENTEFIEEGVDIRNSRMDFYVNPFRIIANHYFVNNKAELNEFTTVEATDYYHIRGAEYKTNKLKIGAKINIAGLVEACIDYTIKKVFYEKQNETDECSIVNSSDKYSVVTNTNNGSICLHKGNFSIANNTGFYSVVKNIGKKSVATNTGLNGVAMNTGNFSIANCIAPCSAALNTGTQSVATNTGSQSVASNEGEDSIAANTGVESVATNAGSHSVAINVGCGSSATAEGKESFAIATGIESKAKGKKGCYIAVAEWAKDENGEYNLVNFKTHKVDGKTIKEDIFYTLKNGKFVEVTDE